MAVKNKQNCPALIVVSDGIHLGQKDVLQPRNSDFDVSSILGKDVRIFVHAIIQRRAGPVKIRNRSVSGNSRDILRKVLLDGQFSNCHDLMDQLITLHTLNGRMCSPPPGPAAAVCAAAAPYPAAYEAGVGVAERSSEDTSSCEASW